MPKDLLITPPTPTPEPAPAITPEPAAPETPTTPAPAPETPEAPDVTDALRANATVAALLSGTKKKAKAAKPAPETPAPAPAEPAPVAPPAEPVATKPEPVAPAPATPPATEPAKVKVRKPQRQLSPEEIANIAAEAAARVQPKPAEAPSVSQPEYELPEELKPMAEMFQHLEKLNPGKYTGIARKQAEFMKKELDYATAWEDREARRLHDAGQYDPTHPPKFDANDPQHASFYKRNQVEIDPKDVHRAEVAIEVQREIESRITPQLKEYQQKLVAAEAQPKAIEAVNQFGGTLYSQLNPGEALTPESFQKWAEANPIEAEISNEINAEVRPVVHAASLLWDGAIPLDPQNPTHATAQRAFDLFEQALTERAAELQPNEKGQTWIPAREFAKLPPAKQAKHFTTTKEALITYIGLNAATTIKNRAKQQKEFTEKMAARLGYVKPQPSSMTAQATSQTPAKPAPVLHSPSISGGAPTTPTTGVAPSPVAKPVNVIGKLLGAG